MALPFGIVGSEFGLLKDNFKKLREHCRENKIIFKATWHDSESVWLFKASISISFQHIVSFHFYNYEKQNLFCEKKICFDY